jgi:pyruvate dehydrogenase E2 component (dihydrolipoamide acetyltransferase)
VTDLKLPLLGDVMTEGTLAAWLVADGSHVARGDAVYRLETDKVTYEVEAPAEGILQHMVAEGSVVPVGTVVGRVLDHSAQPAPAAAPAGASEAAVAAAPSASAAAAPGASAAAAVPGAASADGESQVRATPMARRLARERGIDLKALDGGGRMIREADVLAASTSPSTAGGQQLSGRRKVIAERMHASLQQMAQLTISMEVDFTAAGQLRQQLKQLWPAEEAPTVTDLVVRAAILALHEHPALNATLAGSHLTRHEAVHVGLAVDADEGLIVPVIRGAEALPVRDLSRRARELSTQAREGNVELQDLQGGTFTVTNLGHLGIDFFTPIVNPPQVGILGIGRVFTKLALHDGKVEERSALYLNLSFDHRAVDGAPAARFLGEVKRLLELPAALIV